MHLPDRGRADRLVVDPLEELRDRLAQPLDDDAAHLGRRLGRHAVLQDGELLAVLVGRHRRDRYRLAQLDVEPAQPQDVLEHQRRILVVQALELLVAHVALGQLAHQFVPDDQRAHQLPEAQHPCEACTATHLLRFGRRFRFLALNLSFTAAARKPRQPRGAIRLGVVWAVLGPFGEALIRHVPLAGTQVRSRRGLGRAAREPNYLNRALSSAWEVLRGH